MKERSAIERMTVQLSNRRIKSRLCFKPQQSLFSVFLFLNFFLDVLMASLRSSCYCFILMKLHNKIVSLGHSARNFLYVDLIWSISWLICWFAKHLVARWAACARTSSWCMHVYYYFMYYELV